jgi:hypothetical protein
MHLIFMEVVLIFLASPGLNALVAIREFAIPATCVAAPHPGGFDPMVKALGEITLLMLIPASSQIVIDTSCAIGDDREKPIGQVVPVGNKSVLESNSSPRSSSMNAWSACRSHQSILVISSHHTLGLPKKAEISWGHIKISKEVMAFRFEYTNLSPCLATISTNTDGFPNRLAAGSARAASETSPPFLISLKRPVGFLTAKTGPESTV